MSIGHWTTRRPAACWPFYPTLRKGQSEHRQGSSCRNPSHRHCFLTLILATVLESRFQTLLLSIGTDASGVQKIDFPHSPTLETADFTFSRRWAKMTVLVFDNRRAARRANRDPLGLRYQVLGISAPDCGCQKTAGSSTRPLPSIVQHDTAWKLPGGTTEKVDFTCAPQIANDSRFI